MFRWWGIHRRELRFVPLPEPIWRFKTNGSCVLYNPLVIPLYIQTALVVDIHQVPPNGARVPSRPEEKRVGKIHMR